MAGNARTWFTPEPADAGHLMPISADCFTLMAMVSMLPGINDGGCRRHGR